MSQYHVDRIAGVLDSFDTLVDMSDWAKRSAADTKVAFLQRSLAALCIKAYAGVDDTTAADAVVDAYNDGGIDAIFFDQLNGVFYFVQSKWNKDGSGSIDEASCTKFASGVRDVLAGRIEHLNEKLKKKESMIQAALRATGFVKIVLITVHTGAQKIGAHGKRKVDELVNELQLPSDPDCAVAHHLNQEAVYNLITSFTKPPRIDLPITL